jgi:hypothetical protein
MYNRLFDKHAGEILCKAALRTKTTRISVTDFVERVVEFTLPQENSATNDALRRERRRAVCDAMMALSPEYLREYFRGTKVAKNNGLQLPWKDIVPAMAAATGSPAILAKFSTTPFALLRQGHDLFPSALQAAIASDQIPMLEKILQYLVENVKGKRDSGSWKDMRKAAEKIGKALCVAIRLHKNIAANMLFDFRNKNTLFAQFSPGELGHWLFNDAVRHRNIPDFGRVPCLRAHRNRQWFEDTLQTWFPRP